MKVIVQRVKYASCTIDNKVAGKIDKGFMVLVGFGYSDNEETVRKVADKMVGLRVFEDENGKMNLELNQVNGEILSISQFTLYADCRHGKRPSFTDAAKPDISSPLYDYFNEYVRSLGYHVETGIFGADMKIELLNDGPVTIILESDKL